jgi:iron complex outermembrane recepter protein
MLRRGLVFNPATGATDQLVSNIGKAEVNGVEAGLTWHPLRQLTLNTTATYYLDSEITGINALNATNLPGDAIDYVPEFSYTVGGVYDFDWSATLPGYFRMDYSYRDKVSYIDLSSFPIGNTPQYSDDISLLAARLGLTIGQANVELFGTNLTNENKWIDPYHAWNNANRTRPREIGVKVAYQF